MNRMTHRTLSAAGLAGLLLTLLLATGCQRVAPIRTLPSWVRGIYIPMFKNSTFEPGLSQEATRLTQEAFLADGQVDVVPKEQADLVLVCELLDWQSETVRTRGDHIGRNKEVTLTVGIKLFDPFDMERPRADLGTVLVRSNFNTDFRSITYDPEPDRRHELLESLARQVLVTVINGFPANLPDLPPGTNIPQYRAPETIPPEQVMTPPAGQATP